MALTVDNCAIAYLTMRSLGYGRHGHILQLAAKFHNGKSIAVWIEPSKYVSKHASEIEGLEARYGKLFYHNDFLPTVPMEVALRKILMFLKSSPKPVVIVSHAGQFVFVLLLQAIMETNMVDQFDSVVVGFSDSLPRFIDILKDRKGPGKFELDALARDILDEKYEERFLEAEDSLKILERLVNGCSLMPSIIEHHKCFEKSLLNEMGAQYSFDVVEDLIALREIVTIGLIKRFAEAGVTCSSLQKIYREEGVEKLKQFLSEKQANGKARFTDSAEVHQKLITFLQNPPKPRAIEHVQAVDQDTPEINENMPIYAQVDPFKKRQDRINREIDLLRQQQTQSYEDVDFLRQPNPSHPPADRYRRPSWGLYPRVDSSRNPPSVDRYSRAASGLYEDIDSVETRAAAPQPVARYSRAASGLYEDIDSVETRAAAPQPVARYSRAASGLYEDIDSVETRAAAPQPVARYSRAASGLYEDIDSVETRAAAPQPVAQYSRRSEGIREDPDAVMEAAPEESVELRKKRESQINRADPSGSKRRAIYKKLGPN